MRSSGKAGHLPKCVLGTLVFSFSTVLISVASSSGRVSPVVAKCPPGAPDLQPCGSEPLESKKVPPVGISGLSGRAPTGLVPSHHGGGVLFCDQPGLGHTLMSEALE